VLLRSVPVADQRMEPIKVSRRDGKGDANSHPPDSHAESPVGIPDRIQMSDLIH
jgi:hypothetical protein